MTHVPHIIEIALLLLIVFLIGCALGFLARSYLMRSQNRADASSAESRPEAAGSDETPPTLSEPRNGEADNLKRISGIGPGIEKKLNDFGIFHIDQIARWDDRAVTWIDAQLAFRGRIEREKWVEQAREIEKGDG